MTTTTAGASLHRVALLLLAALTVLCARASAQAVVAEVDTTSAVVGQPIELRIIVEGDARSQPPDVASLDGFRVASAGSSTQSHTYFDGSRTVTRSQRLYQFRLTPVREGTLTIPAIPVRIDTAVVYTEPITISVDKPGELPDFKLRLEIDNPTPFVGEPVSLRLTWYLAESVRTAEFSMPELPAGVEMYDPPQEGVSHTDFRSGRYFEVEFLGQRAVGRAGEATLDGRRFSTLTIEKLLIFPSPGEHTLGPATVSFTQLGRNSRPDPLFGRSLFADTISRVVASGETTIRVRPLPMEGRPPHFRGLVGEFTLDASLDRADVRVGDPMTLTVRVEGDAPLSRVRSLELEGQGQITSRFKLSPDAPRAESSETARIFTTTVRATTDEVRELPPIELPYFDPRSERYEIARSEPIPLRVEATERVTLADALGRDAERARPQSVVAPNAPTPATIPFDAHAVLDRVSPTSALALVRSPATIAVVAAPPALWVAVAGAALVRRRRGASVANRRKRLALRVAERELEEARAARGEERAHRVSRAVRGFVADCFGGSADTLTSDDAIAALREHAPTHAETLASVLNACDAARFSGGGDIDDRVISDARDTLRAAHANIRKGASRRAVTEAA